MLFGWVGLAEFARKQGVHPVTLRRWVLALHEQHGDLVRSKHRNGKPRKYWVHPQRLEAALRADPEAKSADRDFIEDRVTVLERKVEALKKSHKAVKAQVNQLAFDFAARTSVGIVGHDAAPFSMSAPTGQQLPSQGASPDRYRARPHPDQPVRHLQGRPRGGG